MTHICVGKLTIIDSDNGLSPGRRQASIRTNAGILLIGPMGTNFSENLAEIIAFSFKKMYLKVPSAKWRPFCLGLNELKFLWLSIIWASFLNQLTSFKITRIVAAFSELIIDRVWFKRCQLRSHYLTNIVNLSLFETLVYTSGKFKWQ